MPEGRFSGLGQALRGSGLRRALGDSRRRRVGAAVGAIGLAAVAIGAIVSAELPSSSQGAGRTVKSSGAATVQRRDLIATDTESGTLGYADPQTVFNRLSGTITSLPAVGHVVKPGQTLYRVDGAPIVLMDGNVPAYRSLSDGVTAGADVAQLKRNLVDLGFDPSRQITINDTFDAATTAAVERWQASLGQTQTGTVTLGQFVFLPGPQRITAVSAALGSNGGSSASGSGTTATGASTAVLPRPEFVELTTPVPDAATTTQSTSTTQTTTTPTTSTQTTTTQTTTTPAATHPGSGSKPSAKTPSSAAVLLALLKAEMLELKKELAAAGGSSRSTGGAGSGGGGVSGGGGRSGGGGGGGGAAGGAAGAGGASTAATSASGSGGATAQPILQTTSTKLVVTVDLDATKQTEAVVGEPVSVQLPSGGTVGGRITAVSPVAQSTGSSSGSGSGTAASGSGTGGSSSAPTATIPVTIDVTGHHPLVGLDQAAVSVNFEQQVERNVLSVPVSALLATAGGGYAVQELAAPHRLIPVTPGLFAAGFVQISGAQIVPRMQVTDSQG